MRFVDGMRATPTCTIDNDIRSTEKMQYIKVLMFQLLVANCNNFMKYILDLLHSKNYLNIIVHM
jgi:hypothetical protein